MQRMLSGLFLVLLVAIPAWDATRPESFDWLERARALVERRASPDELDLVSRRMPNLPPGSAFEEFEHDLEQASHLRRWLRTRLQRALGLWGSVGNAKVVFGPEGVLLHRPSLEYVLGPPFRGPAPAIERWHAVLERLGIELLVVPVPAKASCLAGRPRARNAGFPRFAAELERAGIGVLDLSPTYLRTDTHWDPAGMRTAARSIADALIARGWVARGQKVHERRKLDVERIGDLGRLLDERLEADWIEPDRVTIEEVVGWKPDSSSPVLLLGDSFVNVFSLPRMGWGNRAGLAEHLSVELGFDVDRIAINGDGARASREALQRAGLDRLTSTRVIVFLFAARELRYGDWSDIAQP